MDHLTGTHPVLACAAAIGSALKDVADLDPAFMPTPDKREALLRLTELSGRLEELRLRVLATAGEVAAQVGARDQAAWLAHAAHLDRPECRRDLRFARALETRCQAVAAGMREGTVNPAQAAVIVRALADLPEGLDPEICDRAEAHLVQQAGQFGPRSLRILGRRVLAVVAPEVAEEEERKLLERDEARAQRRTFLTSRANGDGTPTCGSGSAMPPRAGCSTTWKPSRAPGAPRPTANRSPTGGPTTSSSATPSPHSWNRSTRILAPPPRPRPPLPQPPNTERRGGLHPTYIGSASTCSIARMLLATNSGRVCR